MRLPSGMKLVNLLCGWWTVLVFAFLYLPIVLLIVYSFNKPDPDEAASFAAKWNGFTLDWYQQARESDALVDSLKNSLVVACWATVVSVALGTAGAWLLHRFRYRFKRLWETLLFIPMAIPEVIMGISLLILFAAAAPAVNSLLDAMLGAPDEPRFSRGLLTITIAHITFCFPFVLIAVQARLADVDPSLEEAALDLGATPLRAFWKVMVPYMMPGIVSGALMAFALSMDEFLVTTFVSGGADSQTLPLYIYGQVKKGINPMLNAVSALFVLATILLVVLAERIRKLNR